MKFNRVLNCDVLEGLRKLPDESVDCIVTSPPYWGLRDYGVEGQLGLEPTLEEFLQKLLKVTLECKRVLKKSGVLFWNHGDCYGTSTSRGSYGGWDRPSRRANNEAMKIKKCQVCGKEFKGSVLRQFCSTKCLNTVSNEERSKNRFVRPKCLAGQNYRLLLRMVDEQKWIWRNTIIWHKPNSMPSSVKDRFSNRWEPVFMLVKNNKTLWHYNIKTGKVNWKQPLGIHGKENIDWEWKKVGVITEESFNVRVRDTNIKRFLDKASDEEKKNYGKPKLKKVSLWRSFKYFFDLDAVRVSHTTESNASRPRMGQGDRTIYSQKRKTKQDTVHNRTGSYDDPLHNRPLHHAGKNRGDVWRVTTQPFKGAHFAVFPEHLVKPMILSGCPREVCKVCDHVRTRITKKGELIRAGKGHVSYGYKGKSKHQQINKSNVSSWSQNFVKDGLIPGMAYESKTIGWTDCDCKDKDKYVPGTVLDPFAGAGTTLKVAQDLGRNGIGIELNPEYIKIIEKRLHLNEQLTQFIIPKV